jgi:hypothetical protein
MSEQTSEQTSEKTSERTSEQQANEHTNMQTNKQTNKETIKQTNVPFPSSGVRRANCHWKQQAKCKNRRLKQVCYLPWPSKCHALCPNS